MVGRFFCIVRDSADLFSLLEHYLCFYRIETEHNHFDKANDVINE